MSFGGGSSGGGQTTTQSVQPYSAAQPALNQIISEAGQLYAQGPQAAGYVAPTQQTLQGLATQETMANAANQQLAATLGGQYLNPFLSPLIQKTASDITTNVQSQFSGAGRTPTSPMAQSTALGQVAQAALPLAFGQYDTERQRQLAIASRSPTLIQTGQQLEQLQRQQNMAPALSLQQYAGLVSPIASGFPVTSGQVNTRSNPLTTAAGGAILGSAIPGVGPLLGAAGGFIGGLL
ncbi:hypothetical protein [uncultured Mediterranean phage uvMED]|nr:hypothetical protein [uncultured Mediterranean phage uvMED]